MKMKKIAALFFSAVLTAGSLAGCGGSVQSTAESAEAESTEAVTAGEAEDRYAAIRGTTLNLYTWDDMFPQEVLDAFQEQTGVTINYSNFEYDEDMLAKLEETQGGDYDVVIADDYILEMVNQEGLAMELDKSKLTHYENLDPLYLGLFYDPEDKYDVPYGAGVPQIVYDPSLTDVEIKGFRDLMDPSLEDNVAITANYRVIDGFILKMLGESMNCEDVEKIAEAGEELLKLAPNIRAIIDDNTQNLLLSGEVAAAFLYSSQVTQALMENSSLKAVIPEEGMGFGTMCMFIPSQAPNPEAAHAFINFIIDAETSAACFEYIGYYNTTKAAEEFISDEMKQYIVLPEGAEEGEAVGNISDEANAKHEEIWAAFQTACG